MILSLRSRRARLARWIALGCAVGVAAMGWLARSAAARSSGVIWSVATATPAVALTFDDGPDPTYTPQVLALLRRYHAVATFFVLGTEAARYPQLIRQERGQGSEVCSHGWTHVLFRGLSAPAIRSSLDRTQQLLQGLGAGGCRLFRFPYFASDAVARSTVQAMGYRIVAANIDTRDWSNPGVARMVRLVLSRADPGSIILFHDAGGARRQTVAALAQVLAGLPAEDLRTETLTQLLAHGRPAGVGGA